MSGHITRMSRGSRVGSSSSRPTSTSRSTSTWRAGPWQACTWRLRSSGVVAAAGALVDASGRGWRAGRAGASRAGSSARRRPARADGVADREARAVEGALQLAGVAAERGEQRVADQLGRRVVVAGDRRRRAPASASHSAGEGCGSQRWTSRCSPSAREQLDLGRPAAGCARTATAGRAGRAPAPPSRSRRERRGVPDVGRRRVDPRQQPPPQLGLPGQVGVERRRRRRRCRGPRASR